MVLVSFTLSSTYRYGLENLAISFCPCHPIVWISYIPHVPFVHALCTIRT